MTTTTRRLRTSIGLLALVGVAAAAAAQPDRGRLPPAHRRRPAFAAVVIDDLQPRFTGAPISLSLKDADVRDVLKTFAELTRLNVVVDPAVSGSVTVELHQVPWDQALDLILRMNGLGWVLMSNVLYVAPRSKLITVFPRPGT